MKLTFLYHPVKDLQANVAFYRDVLGWDEAWRMGDDTAAMQIPASEVQVMLTVDPDPAAVASGFYEVENVDEFCRSLPDGVKVIDGPRDDEPIRYAAIADPAGNVIRIFTQLEPGD